MAKITGSNAVAGMKLGETFGTAVEIGTGDVFKAGSITKNVTQAELVGDSIGAGVVMDTNFEKGILTPSVTISKNLGYQDGAVASIAQFFGEDTVTDNTGSYTHLFEMNEEFNSEWITLAHQVFEEGSFEYPSCTVTKHSFTIDQVPNYVKHEIELLANDFVIDSVVNTYDSLEDATLSADKPVVAFPESEFLINAQADGALSNSTDLINVMSYSFSYEKPQEVVAEIKGEAGNGQPRSSGIPIVGTLTLTFRALDDMTYFEAFKDGDEFKASLSIVGGDVVTGKPYKCVFTFPRLKIVQVPDWNLAELGDNPLTVTFKCLAPSAAPTGMSSLYPAIAITNAVAAAYI